jgi:hypothetical protein
VRRCVFFIFCLLLAVIFAHAACADDAGTKSAKQPVGIFTYEDDEKILAGIGTTKPLATLDVSRGEIKVGSTGTACTNELAGTAPLCEIAAATLRRRRLAKCQSR